VSTTNATPDRLDEPRPEQIIRTRRRALLRPHRPLRCSHGITPREIARFQDLKSHKLAISPRSANWKIDSRSGR
jgi:hypothetical protein